MSYVLITLSVIAIIVAYVGTFFPGLSGPPFAWLSLLLLYFIEDAEVHGWVVILTALLAIASVFLEWVVPAYGAKKFNGSKYGIRGSYIGLLIGIIFPIPYGFILGPFLGAFVGELFYDWKDYWRALKAAFGTFVGFIFGIVLNFVIVALLNIIWFFYVIRWAFF